MYSIKTILGQQVNGYYGYVTKYEVISYAITNDNTAIIYLVETSGRFLSVVIPFEVADRPYIVVI